MRPMSLAERGLETPTVGLGKLLDGGRPDLAPPTCSSRGDPRVGLRVQPNRVGSDRQLHRPHSRLRHPRVRAHLPRPRQTAWMADAAATSCSRRSATQRRRARSAGAHDRDTGPRSTMDDEEVPAWSDPQSAAPVHQMADPAIAARLLGTLIQAGVPSTCGRTLDGSLASTVSIPQAPAMAAGRPAPCRRGCGHDRLGGIPARNRCPPQRCSALIQPGVPSTCGRTLDGSRWPQRCTY